MLLFRTPLASTSDERGRRADTPYIGMDMDNNSKRKKKKGWLLYILLALSIAAAIVFAVLLGIELYTNWQSQSFYNDMTDGIETRPRPTGNPKPTPDNAGGSGDNGDDTSVGEPDIPEDAWEPYMDFEALRERYPGIVGWIKIEGTVIDYPIMQWTDNSFFLDHLPDGTSHRSGSIFLDYRNSPDFSDKSSAIYGHAMRTQDMFGSLKNFREQEFYESHRVAHIYTPEKDYELVLIAGYRVPADEPPPFTFRDGEDFLNHIENTKRLSREYYFVSDVEVGPDDRIVNLCTCTYEFENARLIIVGKLV